MNSKPHQPPPAQSNLEIVLPDPCLAVLCGPSGSGKTTFAERQFRPTQVVSSDRCRALISDSETFGPETSSRAFQLLYETIRHRLALRRLTVADTTALERGSRARLLALGREFGLPVVLILFAVREEECRRRSALRERDVGGRVIARQHRLLQTSLLSIASEPFQSVHIVNEDMLDRLRVRLESERTPETGAPEPADELARHSPNRPSAFEGWIDPWDSVAAAQADWGASAQACQAVVDELPAPKPEDRLASIETLTAAEMDPRWIVCRPAIPVLAKDTAEVPGLGTDQSVSRVSWCERMRELGFSRLCLEAWPRWAQPAVIVAAREPYHALRMLGLEGWGTIFTGAGRRVFDESTTETIVRQIVQDLDNAAYFTRSRSPLFIAQALVVWRREEGGSAEPEYDVVPRTRRCGADSLRLWLTDLLVPAETNQPDDPDFLWSRAETGALCEAFGPAPRLLLDLREHGKREDSEAEKWWANWGSRAEWRIVLTRATRLTSGSETEGKGRAHEVCDIGWSHPAVQLDSSVSAEERSAQGAAIWNCRTRALEAVTSGATAGRPWRPWVVAAWALKPLPAPAPQRDLFLG